jgi:hypothetical protein
MTDKTIYAKIIKRDDEKRMVYGYASTEGRDSQGEVIKSDAMKNALPDYLVWSNVREMHQASAVGKTKSAEIDEGGLYISAKSSMTPPGRKCAKKSIPALASAGACSSAIPTTTASSPTSSW